MENLKLGSCLRYEIILMVVYFGMMGKGQESSNSPTLLESLKDTSTESTQGVKNNDEPKHEFSWLLDSIRDPIQTFDGLSSVSSHSSVFQAGGDDDLSHPCLRHCDPDTQKMVCHYKFEMEWYITMSKACYDCPRNASHCFLPHCVISDGVERPITVVNRRLPGPSIQVCEGDEIMVDVENALGSETTSIHWHGIHQKGTPYMDGVPFITQCPIQPMTTFRYHFLADLPGTHYWHSHSGYQRADGVFGSLIVRSKRDSHSSLYDEDNPLHVVMITDWMDRLGIDKFVNHHHTEHENKPYNILINGIGKYKPLEVDSELSNFPLYEFRVRQGYRYRFRTISNAVQNCPIEISVDNHTLLVVASDGQNIQPVSVNSLVIYAGERWDFVVNANQPTGVYWFKFRGLLDCDDRFLSAHQIAVFRYEGATGLPGAPDNVNYQMTKRDGFQLNSLNAAPGISDTFLTAADVRGYGMDEITSKYRRNPDHTFWINYDFYARDDNWFHHKEFYGFYDVVKKKRMYVPQLNNISLKLPNVPPLSQPDSFDQSSLCNSTSVSDCGNKFCHCVHTLSVELGSLVEIILVDTGVVYYANHPFHLHGHVFAVVGMERLGDQTTLEDVKKLDRNGKLQRNLENPPLKDSVTVPDGGYTVFRFIANNPGYWLFHCHLSFHAEVGMALVFHVGHKVHLPTVPEGFPKCGSWVPNPVNDLTKEVNEWKKELVKIKLLSGKDGKQSPYDISKKKAVESGDSTSQSGQPTDSNVYMVLLSIFYSIMMIKLG